MADQPATSMATVPSDGGDMLRGPAGILVRSRNWFFSLQPQQRFWAVFAFAATLGMLGVLFWSLNRTDWRTLYAGMDPGDARAMSADLTAAQIPFDVSSDGTTLLVPAANLDKARLATTARGGPHSGRMGFELFDKPNWVGSEFDERVNYQRALEGELEHTVGTLTDISSARVHLVLPTESLFAASPHEAKASVVLKLRHPSLSVAEADSIRNLISAAVDRLSPENVILVDADGHGPLGTRTGEAAEEEHAQALSARLVETLEPVVGVGNVRATVNLEYDHSASDQVEEKYDPDQSAPLSMQRTEQNMGTQTLAAGVPGTASNALNSNQQVPVYPSSASQPQSVKEESGTYGVSKTTRHTNDPGGRLHRITAALVVNDREENSGAGKTSTWKPRSTEELQRIQQLAQAALGYDQTRGDVVSVANIGFESNQQQAAPSILDRSLFEIRKAETPIRYGAQLLGILLVLVLVVRPAIGRAARLPSNQVQRQAALYVPTPEPMDPAGEVKRQHAQVVFEKVTEEMKREPTQSSRLLQSWIHSE